MAPAIVQDLSPSTSRAGLTLAVPQDTILPGWILLLLDTTLHKHTLPGPSTPFPLFEMFFTAEHMCILPNMCKSSRGLGELQPPWCAAGTQPARLKRESPWAMLILRLAAHNRQIFLSGNYIFGEVHLLSRLSQVAPRCTKASRGIREKVKTNSGGRVWNMLNSPLNPWYLRDGFKPCSMRCVIHDSMCSLFGLFLFLLSVFAIVCSATGARWKQHRWLAIFHNPLPSQSHSSLWFNQVFLAWYKYHALLSEARYT